MVTINEKESLLSSAALAGTLSDSEVGCFIHMMGISALSDISEMVVQLEPGR